MRRMRPRRRKERSEEGCLEIAVVWQALPGLTTHNLATVQATLTPNWTLDPRGDGTPSSCS